LAGNKGRSVKGPVHNIQDGTKGHGKLKEGRFRSDIRKKFFALRVLRPWPGLPREAVPAASVAGFKVRLDGTWSSLGRWKGSLPVAGGWSEMICKVPSNSNQSIILWSVGKGKRGR